MKCEIGNWIGKGEQLTNQISDFTFQITDYRRLSRSFALAVVAEAVKMATSSFPS